MSCFIQVYGRIRPSANEKSDIAIKALDETRICCDGISGKDSKIYQLHKVFTADVSQQNVYNCVAKQIVAECSEGVNGTIFAYGQTGSGKTHTMLGPNEKWTDPEHQGLIPRCVDQLFQMLMKKSEESVKFKYTVNAEFVEFYNEDIIDLIGEPSANRKITLRDIGSGVQLIGSQSIQVENYVDLMNVVRRGWEARKTGETEMNRDSSRSHAVLIIHITTEESTGNLVAVRNSTLNLVDLAGSERQAHTKSAGTRLKEAAHINQSLTVLGRCIRELSKKGSRSFIPYRESLLTHILKNSLGGNSRTAVIVNMHPDARFINETSSTLQFASACSMIKNQIVRNEQLSGDKEEAYKETINNLRHELKQLSEKYRSKYAEILEASEQERKEMRATLNKLLEDYNELKTKYECHLIQSTHPSLNESGLVQKLLESRQSNVESIDDVEMKHLKDKFELTKMELSHMTEEYNKLKQEVSASTALVNEYRQESILMNTPNKNKRRSSRNPRRETIFIPSSRISDENENDKERIVELEQMVAELSELNKQLTESSTEKEARIDKLVDRIMLADSERTSEIQKLKKREENLIEMLEGYKQQINVHTADKLRGESQCKDLMAEVRLKEEQISEMTVKILEKERIIEEKCREIDEMDGYHKSEIERVELQLKQAAADRSLELNETLQKQFDEMISNKDQEIARLEDVVRRNQKDLANFESYRKTAKEMEVKMNNLERVNEELCDSEKDLKVRVADLTKTLETQRAELHGELKKLKMKFKEEKEELAKKLEDEKYEHNLTRQHSVEDYKKRAMKFDELLETSKRKWQIERDMALQEKEEEVRAVCNAEKRRFEQSLKQQLIKLEAEVNTLKKINAQDSAKIVELTGGVSRGQKIKYVSDLRQQISDLIFENETLRAELPSK